LPLTLKNFSDFYHVPLKLIYKWEGWKRLCSLASQIDDFPAENEKEIIRAISKKWLSCSSTSYFQFVLSLAKNNFNIELKSLSEIEKSMVLMLYYDVWQSPGCFESLEESIKSIGKNLVLTEEIIEVLEILLDKIDYLEYNISLPYNQPLKLHSRYTRDQILVAFKMSTFDKISSNKIGVGVAENKEINTEILFVDLIKSEEDYSSTTLYNDFAINEYRFHWQSQNSARPDKGKGLSYINHKSSNKTVLLFVREKKEDEYKNTISYVFLGDANFIETYGSKPMSITWELKEPMPPYLWKDSVKMAIG
jgi:hypothetical protein